MKGAIAAFVAAAARFLAKRGADFAGSISLLITGDEEGPAINGTKQVLDWLRRRRRDARRLRRRRADLAATLGDMVKIGRRGSMTGRLTVEGRAGPRRLSAPRRQSGPSAGADARTR